MRKLSGILLKHCKNTRDAKTVAFPLPKTVAIAMSQNMGAVCEPLVNIGEKVNAGQKIGDSSAYLSAPVHSSVSGTVKDIKDHLMPNGKICKSVVIEADGKQTISEEISVPNITDKKSLIKAVRESGVCGLGGAGFPTHAKLNYDQAKTPVDTLVINAAECEPYITSDYRELMEHPDDVLAGTKLLMKHLNIAKAKICIEKNKPLAIKKITEISGENPDINIITLPSEYPQGAEKIIAYAATGRIIREGELPSSQGVMVINVSTVSFIYRYSKTGMPLISRRLTVDGNAVKNPCNVEALIGTSINDILEYAEAANYQKLLAGGPMMGTCLYDRAAPILKTHNAVLAFKNIKETVPTACIRCGRCIKACPMNLMPALLESSYNSKNIDELKRLRVMLCMNCGCCTYVCPAGRPLAEKNQLAKMLIPR